jgi:hypothetical protein
MEITDISGTWEVKITCKEPIYFLPGSEWLLRIDPKPARVGSIHPFFKFTAIVTINQNNSGISGTFITVHGLSGKVTGNVHGHEVSLAFDPSPIRPEPYHGVAEGIASDKQMRGTYSSADSGKKFKADIIGVKKYSPTIRLKLWWWRNLFPVIKKTSSRNVIVLIVKSLVLPAWFFFFDAWWYFYRQGRTKLSVISLVLCFLSILGFWHVINFDMDRFMDSEWKEKPLSALRALRYYHNIFSWPTLFFTLIHIIALCLFLYLIGIRFTWWS